MKKVLVQDDMRLQVNHYGAQGLLYAEQKLILRHLLSLF